MKSLVSIIVPVYNVERYLPKCLESLKNQTYETIEIIIVDDGSTDDSGKICDDFAKEEKRARVFHKKNGGLSSARNYGIKKAKGEYVCLVDSDDYVKTEFVERMLNSVSNEKIDVVVCGYNGSAPRPVTLTGREATIKLLTRQENLDIIAWNKMYKRELFDSVSYPKGMNYEDNLTTYKLLSKARRVAYIGESLYEYVERGESITNKSKKEEKLKYREKAAQEAIEYFKGDDDLKAAAEISMLTAKIALIDFAVSCEIGKQFLDEDIKWVNDNKNKILKNKFLNQKLRLYITLITNWKAKLYIIFRKIRHE